MTGTLSGRPASPTGIRTPFPALAGMQNLFTDSEIESLIKAFETKADDLFSQRATVDDIFAEAGIETNADAQAEENTGKKPPIPEVIPPNTEWDKLKALAKAHGVKLGGGRRKIIQNKGT